MQESEREGGRGEMAMGARWEEEGVEVGGEEEEGGSRGGGG